MEQEEESLAVAIVTDKAIEYFFCCCRSHGHSQKHVWSVPTDVVWGGGFKFK